MEHKVSLMEITQAQNITLLFSNRIRLGGAGVGWIKGGLACFCTIRSRCLQPLDSLHHFFEIAIFGNLILTVYYHCHPLDDVQFNGPSPPLRLIGCCKMYPASKPSIVSKSTFSCTSSSSSISILPNCVSVFFHVSVQLHLSAWEKWDDGMGEFMLTLTLIGSIFEGRLRVNFWGSLKGRFFGSLFEGRFSKYLYIYSCTWQEDNRLCIWGLYFLSWTQV